MATDATGTPTSPDNIPTYNTSVDAPSGLGFNAAMASIQTIITQLKAGTLASGKIAVAGISATGTPSATTFLRGDGAWSTPVAAYRKSTAKTVNNTVAETDLLNGEITIGAGAIGASGALRLTAHGDMLNNTAAVQNMPRFKLKLGAATLIDTGALTNWNSNGSRQAWKLEATIQNLGAANSQWASLVFTTVAPSSGTTAVVFITGVGQGFATAASGGYGWFTYDGGGSSAVDTASSQALALSVINGVASANYEIVLKGAVVEIL